MKIDTMIELTFSEIHEHLRATDEKRDRLVNLYIIVTLATYSALFTTFGLIAAINIPIGLIISTSAFVIALGIIVIFSEINSRKWHVEYMNCSAFIQAYVKQDLQDPKITEPYYTYPFQKFSTRSLFTSTIILVFSEVSSLVLIIKKLDLINGFVELPTLVALLLIGTLATVVQFAMISNLSEIKLKKAEKEFMEKPWDTWILRGLRDS